MRGGPGNTLCLLQLIMVFQAVWFFVPGSVVGEEAVFSSMDDCLQHYFQSAPDEMTMGQIRRECANSFDGTVTASAAKGEQEGLLETRLRVDRKNVLKPFTIMAHRQNYMLLVAHNFSGYSSEEFEKSLNEDIDSRDTEAQFQISIKTPLALDLFDEGLGIWAAYTVRSFWQVYSTDISSPFRETNHEPEIWLQMQPDWEFWGFKATAIAAGFNHQSNGRAGTISRSWNRLFANFIFEKGNFAFSLKPWYRIPESSSDDDNPDITDFLGHGDLHMGYKYKDHVFTFMTRNNLESGFSKGAVELGWSFPLFGYPYLKGYLQYFSGYGESLIDYNRYVNRLGAGILLTDLL